MNAVYLNNAATSYPKPLTVIEESIKYLQSQPFDAHRGTGHLPNINIAEDCRKLLAKLFNIKDHNRIIFTSGATEGLNLAIKGLNLSNNHVISTTTEHNSVIRVLKELEKLQNTQTTFVKCNSNGYIDPAEIEQAIKKDTKAIIVNHCSNVTGCLQDLKAISEIAKKNNLIFIVDASQSAGCVPLYPEKINIDILVFTGHKALFGYEGIGGIYIKEGIGLTPLKYGGTGIQSENLFQPAEMPLYYEAGTANMLGITSLKAGVEFILSTGIENIYNHNAKNYTYIMESLLQLEDITVYSAFSNQKSSCNLISFNIKNVSPENISYILENSWQITTRSGLHCAPLIHECINSSPKGNVRISWSYLTPEENIKAFISAITQIHGARNTL